MYSNGSVNNNIRYKDICNSENFVINVAYVHYPGYFEVVNNTMVEWYNFYNLITDSTMLVYDFEILKPFIENNKIIVSNWTKTSSLLDEVSN